MAQCLWARGLEAALPEVSCSPASLGERGSQTLRTPRSAPSPLSRHLQSGKSVLERAEALACGISGPSGSDFGSVQAMNLKASAVTASIPCSLCGEESGSGQGGVCLQGPYGVFAGALRPFFISDLASPSAPGAPLRPPVFLPVPGACPQPRLGDFGLLRLSAVSLLGMRSQASVAWPSHSLRASSQKLP